MLLIGLMYKKYDKISQGGRCSLPYSLKEIASLVDWIVYLWLLLRMWMG